MSAALLHVAAVWVDGDQGDEIADCLAERKIEGTRGAVVTFSLDTASDFDFQRTMERLDLADVNEGSPVKLSPPKDTP